jgi:hypothetical protein
MLVWVFWLWPWVGATLDLSSEVELSYQPSACLVEGRNVRFPAKADLHTDVIHKWLRKQESRQFNRSVRVAAQPRGMG